MNFYDHNPETTGEMLERYFPGRDDVKRFLMEPIAYANGSSLDDPAITYGIVFSNFMSKGVYTFRGGTDLLIGKMAEELQRNGVELRKHVLVEKVLVEEADGRKRVDRRRRQRPHHPLRGRAVERQHQGHAFSGWRARSISPPEFVAQARAVRINTSSCQVYLGIRKGESIPHIGDLIFVSDSARVHQRRTGRFSHDQPHLLGLLSGDAARLRTLHRGLLAQCAATTTGTACRPRSTSGRSSASSRNRSPAWSGSSPACGPRSTGPRPPRRAPSSTTRRHWLGTSFGTKFEGLKVSMDLPDQLPGLYHAGSVGIIMSGWLGTINYGVITANNIDKYLLAGKRAAATPIVQDPAWRNPD